MDEATRLIHSVQKDWIPAVYNLCPSSFYVIGLAVCYHESASEGIIIGLIMRSFSFSYPYLSGNPGCVVVFDFSFGFYILSDAETSINW